MDRKLVGGACRKEPICGFVFVAVNRRPMTRTGDDKDGDDDDVVGVQVLRLLNKRPVVSPQQDECRLLLLLLLLLLLVTVERCLV